MSKEKLQKSNTSHSSNSGPVVNDPNSQFGKDMLDALSLASKDFPEPLMTKEELAKY
jgi:hypothetical protein